MNALEFIKKIVPSSGNYCAVAIKPGAPGKREVSQIFFPSVDTMKPAIRNWLENHNDIYYAMSSFTNPSQRTAANVHAMKSVWIDLDCGDKTPYPTVDDGLVALRMFIDRAGLPEPSVVCSGNGLHVYWSFTEDVSKYDWVPDAQRMIRLAAVLDLSIKDPGCTTDSARILRVPTTYNFKDIDHPIAVNIVTVADDVPFEIFTERLKKAAEINGVVEDPLKAARRPLDDVTKALLGNTSSNFKKILDLGEAGCRHINIAVANPADTSEPHWRAVLSIAERCEDRDEAIHQVSSGHPEYSAEATERKASETKGPYTCMVMENHCGSCDGCPNKGQITSPIQLGKVIVRSDSNIIEFKEQVGEVEIIHKTEIPELPWPYFRGKNGGIYKENPIKGEDGVSKGEDALVYEYDLFMRKRLYDTELGEAYLLNLYLPMDGLREFLIPLKHLQAIDKMRENLSMHGVAAGKSKMESIMGYLIQSAKELQRIAVAEQTRAQFGWVDRDTAFVVGTREIMANETRYSPTSVATAEIAPKYQVAGTLEEWKKPMAAFAKPGYELHAFAVLSGLGSILMKFTSQKGGSIGLVNSKSGTGKTTILRAINSFWGHPTDPMLLSQDTANAQIHRMGVLGNLPVTKDELTNITPQAASDMFYVVSQGRAKARMQANANAERANNTSFSCLNIYTSNSFMSDKISSLKMTPGGELMRMLEFEIDLVGDMDKAESEELFGILDQNHGMAGELFVKYILQNKQQVLDLLRDVQKRFDTRMGIKSGERVWSAMIAVNITAGIVAKHAGLLDYDCKAIGDVVMRVVTGNRMDVAERIVDPSDVLGNFINQNVGSIVIASNDPTSLQDLKPALKDARVKAVGRYEQDHNMMYISVRDFNEYCENNQVSTKQVSSAFEKMSTWRGRINKRLLTGTGMVAPPVPCYSFKMNLFDEATRGD